MQTSLQPSDIVEYIGEASRQPIAAISIQGYEPLLPEALGYTRAILIEGKRLGVQTGLISNGFLLKDNIDLLARLEPTIVGVSLDGASAAVHDRLRGVSGAWRAVIGGLDAAVKRFPSSVELAVSSVIGPSKQNDLEHIPALLREVGVKYWILNPLLRITRDGSEVVGKPQQLIERLWRLQEAADDAGIILVVDDTLKHIPEMVRRSAPPQQVFRSLPDEVTLTRLTPSGHYSTGKDILKKLPSDAPRWLSGKMVSAQIEQKCVTASPLLAA